jgi:hypothetical protein
MKPLSSRMASSPELCAGNLLLPKLVGFSAVTGGGEGVMGSLGKGDLARCRAKEEGGSLPRRGLFGMVGGRHRRGKGQESCSDCIAEEGVLPSPLIFKVPIKKTSEFNAHHHFEPFCTF